MFSIQTNSPKNSAEPKEIQLEKEKEASDGKVRKKRKHLTRDQKADLKKMGALAVDPITGKYVIKNKEKYVNYLKQGN